MLDGNNRGCEEAIRVKLTFRLEGSKILTDIYYVAARNAYFSSSGVALASPMTINVEDTPHTGAPGPDLSLAGARFATMLESQAATGLGIKPCLVSILIQRGAFLATLSAS